MIKIMQIKNKLACFVFAIFFLIIAYCSTTDHKKQGGETGIVESIKIKGRIQIDEFKYSGPPKESWIVAGIRDTVTNDFAKVKQIEAISIDDQNKALKTIAERRKAGEKNLDPSKEAAKILAADYLCVGNLQNTGKTLRLNIRLLKAPDFSSEQSSTIDGTLDEIFTLQDKAVESLLANVDAKMTPEERLVIEVFTPRNKKAYELYSQGLEIQYMNPDKALDLFLQALKLDTDYLDAMDQIGLQYGSLNNFSEALNYHRKRKKILEEKNLSNQEAYTVTLNNIGTVYHKQGKYDDALQYYFQSKKIREDLGLYKTSGYASTLNNIGGVYLLSQGKSGEALQYFFQSKKIDEDLGLTKTAEYAIILNNIGLVYDKQGKYDDALQYYFQSKKMEENLGIAKTDMYALYLHNIGGVYDKQGKSEEALQYYFQSKKIREDLGLTKTNNYATTLNNIGAIYYNQGAYCKSADWFKKAVEIREKIGIPSNRRNLEVAQEECDSSKKR